MNQKRKVNFLLYGQGTFLNKGCEAIVDSTLKKIKKSCEGNITLSTNDLEYDKNFFKNSITKYVKQSYEENNLTNEEREKIEYYKTIPFDYTNFEKIYQKDCIKEIENVDICLSVGGDNYCYGEPNWLYTINKQIKEKGKKNVFWCTSIFEEIESEEMIRDLRTYDIVVARESLTYKALSKYLRKERLIYSPDMAFSLEKQEIELPDIFKKYKKIIGINISPLISKYTDKKDNIIESAKALIDYILQNKENAICLIPHVYIKGNNDLEVLKNIKNIYQNEDRVKIIDEKIYNCEELKYIISNCSYLVAARTHASIAGYSSIVPTLVIGYSVKSKGIAIDLFGDHENYVIPVDKMTPEILIEKFKFIQENEKNIKQTLNQKMPEIKNQTENLLNTVLERIEELDKKYITDRSKCTGCMACLNICPNNAIKVVESEDGFLYTKIDPEKCTNCNACRKVCPANKPYSNKYENPIYLAVINKNEKDRINSSSGGVVSAIARKILEKNGAIYGASQEEKQIKHIRITEENELHKIMGSKYAQSKIETIFKKVKEDLEKKIQVLFTGTPCQIEGLKSYLNKKYDNLTCISIICHGVPSPKIFKKYLEEKEQKENSKIEEVIFRDKKLGWHKFSIVYKYKNGKQERVPFIEDTYMKGFLNNYYLRESCYSCQMRFDKKNSADIIIGDFWGIENVLPQMDDDKGISAVIINSPKGVEIFEEIKENIQYNQTKLEDILKANPVLTSSVKYNKNRDQFFELIKRNEAQTSIKMINQSIQIAENDKINKQTNEYLNNELKYWKQEANNLNEIIKILNGQIKDLLDAKKYYLGQLELKDIQIQKVKEEENNLNLELQKIYYSRRWKYSSKIANFIKRIKDKKD